MTPEEAVAELVAGVYIDPEQSTVVQDIINACVATAKADAKKQETLRSAALLKSRRDAIRAPGLISPDANAVQEGLLKCYNEILRTGGLEVDDGRSQTNGHG